MELKCNAKIHYKNGGSVECNYFTNHPIGDTMMTRIQTIYNSKIDIRFDDISYIEYTTTMRELMETRYENVVEDGFVFDDGCIEIDENGIPVYTSDTTVEGYN